MKYFLIPLFLIGFVGSTTADSTIPSATIFDVDFTAATFVEKYQDLLQKGGKRVSVLIKVAGDVESTDPAKRAKEIRYLQSAVLKFLSFSNGINILSNQQKNEITGQIHPHWIEILEERTDVLSVTILDQYKLSKDGTILAPLKQIKAGVSLVDVICNEGKIPVYKYNAMRVACVSSETKQKLIERGWALETSPPDNFEECAAAGNPVMESYPRQCRTPDGKHFVEEIN